jgi:hypothetical protein
MVSDDNAWYMKTAIDVFQKYFMISVDEGAETSVYLADSPDAASVSGRYWIKCKKATSTPESFDPEVAAKLWALSEELVGAKSSLAAVASS